MASVVAAEKTSPGEQDTAPGDSFKTCARSLISDLHMAKDAMESTSIRFFFFCLFLTSHFCFFLYCFFFFFFFLIFDFRSTAAVRKERMQKMLALLKKQRGW